MRTMLGLLIMIALILGSAMTVAQISTYAQANSSQPRSPSMPWGSFSSINGFTGITCGLNPSNKLYCWGKNDFKQLGTIWNNFYDGPMAVFADHTFTQVSPGSTHICALKSDGVVYCWGSNLYGVLGSGGLLYDSSMLYPVVFEPTSVQMPISIEDPDIKFAKISSGYAISCALTTTGNAYCWGRNDYGQLGNGTTSDASAPVAVTMPTGVTFSEIYVYHRTTCALSTTGNAYCWGWNHAGQLGDGTTNDSTIPVAVNMPTGVIFTKQGSVTNGTQCWISTTYTPYCWGSVAIDGYLTTPTIPSVLTAISVTDIFQDGSTMCWITVATNMQCVGDNNLGLFGNGTFDSWHEPRNVSIPSGVTFTRINHTPLGICALSSTGNAYCWGWDTHGQLGICSGTHEEKFNTPQLVQVSGSCMIKTLTPTASITPTPSITPDTTATFTPTTIPTNTRSSSPVATATLVPNPHMLKDIAVGASFTLGLLQNGTLVTWGINNSNQATIPRQLSGQLFQQVETGSNWALALGTNGRVYGWGSNDFNQLNLPSAVQSNITAISAGFGHAMALTTSGNLVIWGRNDFRQIDAPLNAQTGISAVAAGHSHSLAIKNGSVIAWGRDTSNQIKVPRGLANVTKIAAGFDHSLALTQDGTITCWGNRKDGQCNMPRGLKNVVDISAGVGYSMALTSDGTVHAWGRNTFGKARIPRGITNAIRIAAGYTNSVIGLNDGRIIALGDARHGAIITRTPTVTP
ncbi:MAG: hypothetical protein FJ040_07020 [Chloroflexi bacterium]|nr:hypothetical protein [Chloroflexota bacterium]